MLYHTDFKQYYSLGGTTKFTKHMGTVKKKSCKRSHNNNIYKKFVYCAVVNYRSEESSMQGEMRTDHMYWLQVAHSNLLWRQHPKSIASETRSGQSRISAQRTDTKRQTTSRSPLSLPQEPL
jgi:hypothetical protein